MDNIKCTIIIPTHSSYLDICRNFKELFEINWRDCPYEMVFSITGDDIELEGVNCIYNGTDVTLPQCIYNAAKCYESDYYFVFLGDAFICNRVNSDLVRELIMELKREDIEYCSLRPKKSRYPIIKYHKIARYINYKDRYCHSFIAFLANKEFIRSEFSDALKTDLDFELKYLDIANTTDDKCYFEKRVALTKDIFLIKPGIEKGRWNRDVHSYLKKAYRGISLADRPVISIKRQVLLRIRNRIVWYLPDGLRKKVKKKVSFLLGKEVFDTEMI